MSAFDVMIRSVCDSKSAARLSRHRACQARGEGCGRQRVSAFERCVLCCSFSQHSKVVERCASEHEGGTAESEFAPVLRQHHPRVRNSSRSVGVAACVRAQGCSPR
eukprot:4047689-Pleurochrysis_carterae.AAC.2